MNFFHFYSILFFLLFSFFIREELSLLSTALQLVGGIFRSNPSGAASFRPKSQLQNDEVILPTRETGESPGLSQTGKRCRIRHGQSSDEIMRMSNKRHKYKEVLAKKLGSEKNARDCIEIFANLNLADMATPLVVRRQTNKLSPSDSYLAELITKYDIPQKVSQHIFGIGSRRYDRVKKGLPLKHDRVISQPTLAALELFIGWRHGQAAMIADGATEGLHAMYLKRKEQWSPPGSPYANAPLIRSSSSFYVHAGRIILRNQLESASASNFGEPRPLDRPMCANETAATVEGSLDPSSNEIAVTVEAALDDHADEPLNETAATVEASQEGEQAVHVRSLHADLADADFGVVDRDTANNCQNHLDETSDDELSREESGVLGADADFGVVDEDTANHCHNHFDETSDGELSQEESRVRVTITRAPRVYIAALLRALNESVAVLESDSLVDKKLRSVSSSYCDNDGYPISRFTLEVQHICANSNCQDEGMPH